MLCYGISHELVTTCFIFWKDFLTPKDNIGLSLIYLIRCEDEMGFLLYSHIYVIVINGLPTLKKTYMRISGKQMNDERLV